MSKFKIGDKVKVKETVEDEGYYTDKIYTITTIGISTTGIGNVCFYFLNNGYVPFSSKMLYLVDANNGGVPIHNRQEFKQSSDNNGGKTDYYQLPKWVKDADDFAEWRGMDFFQGNILKSVWCFNTQRHSGTNEERELNKIIHYAQKRLNKIRRKDEEG